MTLDEQLQQIAGNLNTLTRIHLDNDREYRERFAQMQDHLDRLDRLNERNGERMGQIMDAMNRLIHVVEAHEQRLDDLERGE